jgi:hypothetical protein
MRLLFLNPYFWLTVVILSLALAGGGFWYGCRVTTDHWKAATGKTLEEAVKDSNARGAAIDKIGSDTSHATAAAVNDNRGSTDESTARIRTVVLDGPCRDVPAVIVHELDSARDDANTALRAGLRSRTTSTDAAKR